VLLAFREVADALIVNDKVRSVIEESRVRSEAAARLLVLQEKRYRAGVVSYFEVLDAQRQLFLAETELVRSRVTQLEAYVELYRALGGGWSP
jgi:multidrug efflux system outer membrane protein